MDADEDLISHAEGLLDVRSRAFLASARTATLATTAPGGRPRLVPICFVLGTDDPAGRVRLYSPLDEKPKTATDPHALARVRDILARPEATLLVDRWSEDWDRLGWLRLETIAGVLEPGASGVEPGVAGSAAGDHRPEHADAVAALRAKYPQYAGHRLEERPLLSFTVERVVAWGALDAG